MNVNQYNKPSSGEEEALSALQTNAKSRYGYCSGSGRYIRSKGLDTMLVDQFGQVVITNDGVTILELMDVNHPAAKMLINIAKLNKKK